VSAAAFDDDLVVAAAHDLRSAARERSGVTARIREDTATVRGRLDALSARLRLRRAVMVVDDNPSSLYALVMLLAAERYPVIAVTHDRTVAAHLASVAAEVVVVRRGWDEVPGLWRRHHPAVMVIDEKLCDPDGTTHSGATLAATLPRGPRVFVVTSETDARDSLADAARVTQAEHVTRTDSGQWMDSFRARVHAAVDEAAG
jgi:CheY-like chemotaxis protein